MDADTIKTEIANLLEKMGFTDVLDAVEVHEGATSRFSVRLKGNYRPPADDIGLDEVENERAHLSPPNMLIGERGNNLASLEHVLKKIIRKKYDRDLKFTLDINDYRMRRLEDLKQDVKAAAKEVRLHHKEVPLRSMSSFERRIVHLLLAEYPDIATESIGQEPNRKVIIKPYP